MKTRAIAPRLVKRPGALLVVLSCLAVAASAAGDPERGPPHPSSSVIRPVPSAMRERLQHMLEKRGDRTPADMRDRMEHMRTRIREARERRESVRTTTQNLDEGLRQENIKREELEKRIEDYKKLRAERRSERRAEIFRRWGFGLSQPEVKSELETHGRRMAKLRRMEILAATDVKGEKRKKLAERIAKLREREKDRHQEAMKKLLPGRGGAAVASDAPPAPAAASIPAPVPATTGGAP